MKNFLCLIGICLLLFIGFFIMAFIFIAAFLNIFVNFNLLDLTIGIWLSLGASIFIALLFLGCFLLSLKSTKSSRFKHLLSQNYPQIILYYILLIIIFVSIKAEIIWSYESLKDVISLNWTIFGISIAIFLVWNVVIIKYLDKAKPINTKKMCSIDKLEYITQKEEFYPKAIEMFNSVKLLIINLMVLVIATAFVFVIKEEVTLLCQNIVIVSFYLSSNTVIELFLDILKPLNEEKKKMLKNAKVTANDIREKNNIEEQLIKACKLINSLNEIECVDEEMKKKMKKEIAFKALQIENSSEKDDK